MFCMCGLANMRGRGVEKPFPPERKKPMKIHFPRLYRYDRTEEPCRISLPFPPGVFTEGMGVRILSGDQELPVQERVLSRHLDGSVRFLEVRFQATLPGNRPLDLQAEVTEQAQKPTAGIAVCRHGDTIFVDAGEGGLRFRLKEGRGHLMESLEDGHQAYRADQFVGPVLKDASGRCYPPRFESWRVEESGPLAAVIRGAGVLGEATEAGECPRFETKLTVYYHKPWMEIAFRLINATNAPLAIASLGFSILAAENAMYSEKPLLKAQERPGDSVGESGAAVGKVLREGEVCKTTGVKLLDQIEAQFADNPLRCCVGRSNYKTNFTVSGGQPVQELVDGASLMTEANEHYAEVFYGTFFADRTTSAGGVCATVFQAQQNYPKAVVSDESGVHVMLVPECADKVTFESGMSREQRMQLHFHGPAEKLAEIDNRSLIYQMPDCAVLDAQAFMDAGIISDIYVSPERMLPDVEIALINRCDAHSRSFGMLNFGDAPDMNYTQQGRGKGKLVWTNNEYDFPHACALLYMRTGERRFLNYAISAAEHWMDVDVCHYSTNPLLLGGQWEHCRRHVLDSAMVCSHEWVEGLLDVYHLTGETRALETAQGIGENVLRLLETPAYQTHGESNARETGWALRTLTALYVETGDLRWLSKAKWIVGHFREWMDEYGSWVAPYTDNTLIHVPFMIAVAMGSLYRYYQVFPSEEVKGLLIQAANDLVESACTPFGLFIYKELPSLNRLGNNTLVLEALTIAYRLSGDKKYLKLGLPSFWRDIASPSKPVGKKTMMEGAVILDNDPPKHFAQSFLPLSVFYKAAADADLLGRCSSPI